jgi:hypothetical protein
VAGWAEFSISGIYGASGEAGVFQPLEDRHSKAVAGCPVASVAQLSVTAIAKRTQRSAGALGLSLEIDNVAEAEPVINVEDNMCGTVMRGAAAPSVHGPQTVAEIYASSSNRLLLQRYAGNAAAVITAGGTNTTLTGGAMAAGVPVELAVGYRVSKSGPSLSMSPIRSP